MKFLSILLLAISSSAFASEPNCDPLDCEFRQTWLKQGFNTTTSVENVLTSIGDRKTQLVIFGESQASFPDSSRYPSYIEQLKSKNTDLNCIFVQGESGYQNILNQYLTQPVSYEETIGSINEQDKTHPLAYAHKDLMLFAKINKLKVLAVRKGFNHLRDQNNYMTTQISNFFKSNECSAGVFFIGKDHVSMKNIPDYTKTTRTPAIIPISTALTNLQISTSTIDLIHWDEDMFWNMDWSECHVDDISVPAKNFGFLIPEGETPAIRPAIFPMLQPEMWSDYDAILAVGAPSSKPIRCNQN